VRTWIWIAAAALVASGVACGGHVSGIGIGGSAGGVGIGAAVGEPDPYVKEIDAWHARRIERLTREDGWLSLIGLHPMAAGTHRLGSADDNDIVMSERAPAHLGTFVIANDSTVTFTAADGIAATHDGKPVTSIALRTDTMHDGPTEIKVGTVRFFVIDRPGSLYLRVKDTDNPTRQHFAGIDRFPVDKRWQVEARLDPYDPPQERRIPNIVGFEEVVQCPGALVFSRGGKEYRLEPVSADAEEWFIVFGDATSGKETYGGGRFVYVPTPGPDGRTVIDFNKSYNPPCVFTEYATCPLPHSGNVLPFPIDAGEKSWGEGH